MPDIEATILPEPAQMDGLSLNEPQREAVEYTGGHLLVLAGAGSGKTRVLACRTAHLVAAGFVEPWRVLAMTFTNKAASEMARRVTSLVPAGSGRIRMGTFHSVCAWILRREASRGWWAEDFSIYDSEDQKALLRRVIRDLGEDGRVTPAQASSWISLRKNDLIWPEEAADSARTPWERLMARIYSSYQAALRASMAFDFDDLLTVSLNLLRQDIDIGGRYSRMFGAVLVDEYQDTNLAQRDLLLALCGPDTQVCAVGDDDQSIYGWRGARVENILRFPEDFPGAKIVRLEQNYRSTSSILRAASSLVSHNSGRHGKTLWSARAGGDDVLVQAAGSASEEAAWTLAEASRLHESRGLPWSEIAILYRTNAQSREFETAALGMSIPYQVIGSLRFYEREEIKDLIAWLRLVANPADRVSLERVINKPPRGLGERGRSAFFEYAYSSGRDLLACLCSASAVEGLSRRAVASLEHLGGVLSEAARASSSGAPASEIVDRIVADLGFLERFRGAGPEEEARLENVEEFRKTALEHDAAHPSAGLPGFLQGISLLTSSDDYEQGADRLVLMTLHCAKGLEFSVVFIAGVEEGLLPFVRPSETAPADLEEERRLMYVGMTRAKDLLYLTYVPWRQRHGARAGGPSRFIAEAAEAFAPVPGEEVTAAAPEARMTVYRRGNLVHHPRYGRGLVLHAVRRGPEWQLTVDFGFDEPKVLLTGYVPIPVIREKGSPGDG